MTNPRKVQVVTDSGSDLPHALRNQYGITVVPLSITFGTESFLDGVDITPEQFMQRLEASSEMPKTAQPASAAFAKVFREAIDKGMDVVCVTISSGLSGTFNSARLAAEEFGPDRVRVVDSLAATMQFGWIVIEAARAAQNGGDIDAVESAAKSAITRANCFAVLQTLDYVYKGGRIGRASHMVGSALGIKPILNFIDGLLTPMERVRTWKKALARATELAANAGTVTDIAVLHADNRKDAEMTAEKLQTKFPQANIVVDWVGPTIGTYAGPGAIGIMTLSNESR
jgi:DegV family protein with EDD domain